MTQDQDQSRIPRPNLFIVGAMKCGTTILFDFLTEHPEIVGARGKEVHYFTLFKEKGEEWYLDHFAGPNTRYRLDASPTYLDMALDCPVARDIGSYAPDAKIIALIRDPLERSESHFGHFRKVNKVAELQEVSFADFLDRKWPSGADPTRMEVYHDQVLGFSRYAEKIERYRDVFGADNVMVLHNDDLRRHGAVVMDAVFGFLELTPPGDADYRRQRYVSGTGRSAATIEQQLLFAEDFGLDYLRACKVIDVRRPPSLPDLHLNEPVSAKVNEVGYGEDGWLFLLGGANAPLNACTASDTDRFAQADGWVDVVRTRARRFQSQGITFRQVMIPEKLSILGEKLQLPIDPSRGPGDTFIQRLPSDLAPVCVNLFNFFRNSPSREQFYLRTDSHWSHAGAFAGYQMICSTLGIQPRSDLLQRPFQSGRVLFDLGSKLPNQPVEEARFYAFRQEAEVVERNPLVELKARTGRENDPGLHVGSSLRFENRQAPDPRRVILFGDSFSEYRDHLLTGLLAETFAELTFVWSVNLDYELIERIQPDLVICAMTERFMQQIASDQFCLDDYVADKMATVHAL